MATALYGLGREAFLGGLIDWTNDAIKVALIDSADYVVSIDVDQFLSDVTAAGIVATSSNFTTKTVTLGVADADNITFSAVSGDVCEALVIYQDTGTLTTSRLIAYLDVANVTGFPVTPNGGDITVTWDSGANKIFKL